MIYGHVQTKLDRCFMLEFVWNLKPLKTRFRHTATECFRLSSKRVHNFFTSIHSASVLWEVNFIYDSTSSGSIIMIDGWCACVVFAMLQKWGLINRGMLRQQRFMVKLIWYFFRRSRLHPKCSIVLPCRRGKIWLSDPNAGNKNAIFSFKVYFEGNSKS